MIPRLALSFALLLGVGFVATAAVDDGFNPLFNGKDLSGWITPDDKDLFSVEDGEIVGRTKDGQLKKNEFLVVDKPYGDFVLKLKVKVLSGNSGVQIRSERAKDGAVAGPQADAASGWYGTFYEERRRGILQQYPKEKVGSVAKDKDWNDYVITAMGDHITVSINGTVVNDLTDSKFEKTGVIGLQVHAGPPMEVRFKDVEIKPL